ncbi:MAG: hypothetical protein Q8L87_04210 [Anaerolineales bacterium]|nr:hypothetical protein [Anaerolineales bacterium]
MTQPINLTSDDPILESLNFKPYRNMAVRHVRPFLPSANEPQTMDVVTPWGATLTAKSGDMLISEVDAPDDAWPVDAEIFDATYLVTEPGFCIKKAVTMLVPMKDVAGGDEDQMVTVHSLEGPQTVRAGDFFLARGIKGEIWSYPKGKVEKIMKPAE